VVEQQIARAPQDVDVRAWRARVLAWSGKLPEAEKEYLEILKVSRTDAGNWMGWQAFTCGKESEFQYALHLDPGNAEAREGVTSARRGTQHELRFGQDNDLLSYSDGFHDEWLSVASQRTSYWGTNFAGNFYQRSE
jgi:hypothetical protein